MGRPRFMWQGIRSKSTLAISIVLDSVLKKGTVIHVVVGGIQPSGGKTTAPVAGANPEHP